MFCCAKLKGQKKDEYPALTGIGAELRKGALFIRALHSDRNTRKRILSFEIYDDDILIQTVRCVVPSLNACDETQHFPNLELEVVS